MVRTCVFTPSPHPCPLAFGTSAEAGYLGGRPAAHFHRDATDEDRDEKHDAGAEQREDERGQTKHERVIVFLLQIVRGMRNVCGSDAVHGDGRRVEPRCDAVWIGGFRLHRDLESVRGRGAGGHGCGGISARLQGVETSAGLHRVSDCLRADGIGCAVDLVIDLDVGGEESASTTRRRVLNELDDNIRRENAEIFREAFLELGLEGREVGVDGALRDRKLNLRLDRELNARDGDFTPIDVAADSGGDGGLDSRRRLRVHGVEAAETQSRLHLGFVGIPEAEEIDIALERAASRLVRLRSAITDDGIEVGAVRVAEDNFPYVVEAARALLPSAILVVACSALGFTVGSRAYSVLCRVLLIYVGAPLAVAGIRRIENVVGPRRVIWPVEALVLPIDQMIERVVYETMTCQGGAELTSIIADGGCGPEKVCTDSTNGGSSRMPL